MKRLILSVLTALTTVTGAFGINGCDKMADNTVITSQTAIISDISQQNFTIQDIYNLQDFLLARPTEEDLRDKNYDLNGDGVWNVFDLCLMKRELLLIQQKKEVGVFDMESKTVLLNSGYEMPIIGLGTYSLLDDTCINSVVAELQSGGRLIDTAYMYHNEESVGKGIKQSGVPREEMFIETKLYPNQYADAANAIDEALEKLDVDYIDLMLLHHPGTNDLEAYKAMEQAVADGKIRSIGLSNWYIEELEDFLPQITIMPALVQNEIHPYYQEIEVVPYIQSLGIVMQGWYPLGGRGYTAELLGNETINSIAEVHNVSAAQVILRLNLQRNVVVIPGSSNPDHIKENLELFDFKLSDEEMEKIKTLNRDEKHDWY